MAQVLRFTQPPTKDAKERAAILNEIRRLALACDVPWETITYFACGKDKTIWVPNGDGTFTVASKDESGEIHMRQVTARVCRDGTPHARDFKKEAHRPAHTPESELDGKRAAEKARYIQRVKMLQRDCEKALPRFDDGTYRAILQAQFNGAESSKELNSPQLRTLLMYLKGLLRDAKGGAAQCSFDAPALLYHDAAGLDRERLMRRIQGALKEKGAREGKYVPWNYALGILKNVTRKVVTEWEDALPVNLKAVIAALHYDAKRKGRRTR